MKTVRAVIVKLAYIVTLLCGFAALFALMNTVMGGGGDNVMQQTGMIAFAIGLGVVPYCIARCVEKILE